MLDRDAACSEAEDPRGAECTELQSGRPRHARRATVTLTAVAIATAWAGVVRTAPAALPPARIEMVQQHEAFVPRVVAIARGSTIDFPNGDPFFHNVFSLSRGATFDLGRFPRGERRSRTFTQAGLIKVYCHLHSHMSASIVVFDHPHFTMQSPDGAFRMDDVPAGKYRVSAWHERIGEGAKPVVVDAGRTSRVEFALPVEDTE